MAAPIPGIGFVDETGAFQAQLPGVGFITETAVSYPTLTAAVAFTTEDAALVAAIELGEAPHIATLHVTLDDAVLTAVADAIVTAAVNVVLADAARAFAPRQISRPVKRLGLLLYENLPLRTSRMLGTYIDDAVLGHVYGDLTSAPFPLVRLTDSKFFVADHPMEVTGVIVERINTLGFEQALESDGVVTWTVVNMAAPVPPGSEVWARGRGKRDPLTGELIRNPADIVTDVMRIAGRDEDWTALRAATSSMRIAGRIGEIKSIRAWVDEILLSIGAIWSPGMARLYPTGTTPDDALELVGDEFSGVDVSATLDDTADILRLAFDRSDASGRMRQQIELTASPQRYGGIVKEVECGWLRSAADAETFGRAALSRIAGERYDVNFFSSQRSIRPGMWLRPVAHPEWQLPGDDPYIMALGVEVNPQSTTVQVRGETTLSTPTIRVTGRSFALSDTTDQGLSVSYANGIATFGATDENGNPLVAFISLDGSVPKATDQHGRASFIAAEGPHRVDIEAQGYVPVSMVITL